jgi:Protein of unknown function (DUF3431)
MASSFVAWAMLCFYAGMLYTFLRRRVRLIFLTTLVLCGMFFFLALVAEELLSSSFNTSRGYLVDYQQSLLSNLSGKRKEFVVASMRAENTSWLVEHFPDWHASVYVVDSKDAELTVEKNKGRESMVYLTYG